LKLELNVLYDSWPKLQPKIATRCGELTTG